MQRGIPSVRCSAKSRQSGERCKSWAIPGGVLCYCHTHNIGPILRKGDERMTLAQLMKTDRRPVGEVLLDAVHVADVIMNEVRAEVEAGDVSVETVTRLLEYSNRAGKLAKTTIDAGVATKLVALKERNLEFEGKLLTDVLTAVMNGLLDAVPVNPIRREQLRLWALDAIVARLNGAELPPVPVEYQAIEAVDAGRYVPDPGAERHDRINDVDSQDEQPGDREVVDTDDLRTVEAAVPVVSDEAEERLRRVQENELIRIAHDAQRRADESYERNPWGRSR